MNEILTATALNAAIVAVAYHLAKRYFTSYVDQKAKNLATKEDARQIAAETERGKNLATKEDVSEITRQIESIKTQYALLVEEARAHNSLRNAVVAERIQAHQEAYSLWQRMRSAAHDEDCTSLIDEAEKWWSAKCLYLDSPAREHFRTAIWATSHHKLAITERWDRDLIKENWDSIQRAGESIVVAASLPGLSRMEKETKADNARAVLQDIVNTSLL